MEVEVHPWWVELLAAVLPTMATVIIGVILRNKQQELHLSMNSKLDLLVETTKTLAHAEGVAEGRQLGMQDTAKLVAVGREEDRTDKRANLEGIKEATLTEASERLRKPTEEKKGE